MYKLLFILFTMISLIISVQAEPTNFRYEDCLKVLEGRTFKSQEELLQLFYRGYYSGKIKNVFMQKSEIIKLKKSIKTLFPIKNLESITVQDTTLTLEFDKEQDVFIPGTFFQASLILSKKVVFNLSHNKHTKMLTFFIDSGVVKVHYSAFARVLKGMNDINGSELFYNLTEIHKESIIGITSIDTIPPSKLIITKISDSSRSIDIDTEGFKNKDDITVYKDGYSMFGQTIKLLANDTILVNGSSKMIQPNIRTFSRILTHKTFKESITEGFPQGLIKNKTMSYNLEQEKGSFSIGFHFSPEDYDNFNK